MTIEKHDVVQLSPEHKWAGCFVQVTEVKAWGIQGFVQVPMEGLAHIRVSNGEFEKIGMAAFILGESPDD